jgi:hypothetical protein
MKWLVMTKRSCDAVRLDRTLTGAGAHRDAEAGAVPMLPDEQVWEVEGPPDLDRRLAAVDTVKKVFPSSSVSSCSSVYLY